MTFTERWERAKRGYVEGDEAPFAVKYEDRGYSPRWYYVVMRRLSGEWIEVSGPRLRQPRVSWHTPRCAPT